MFFFEEILAAIQDHNGHINRLHNTYDNCV